MLAIWSKLLHENVLLLHRYIIEDTDIPSLVHGWQENGTAGRYLIMHPALDVALSGGLLFSGFLPRPMIISWQVSGIAKGLVYLQSQDVVHGDIRSVNIHILNASLILIR